MSEAYICDAIRTPFGRFMGGLSSIRTDDLGALPIKELMKRNPSVDWSKVDDVVYGCANQAGEDNRNVARMSGLLAGLPETVPGLTVNRLCGSGLDAVGSAARTLRLGEASLIIAGGVESMSRSPYVMKKAMTPFDRGQALEDTTIGWRLVNPAMEALYGVDALPQTAENVAEEEVVSREDQDAFALRSQQRWAAASEANFFENEVFPVTISVPKKEDVTLAKDEHPRPQTTLEALTKLRSVTKSDGSVTAGNASGINDGACALLMANEQAVKDYNLTPRAKVVGMSVAGVPPRVMGMGPVPAIKKVLAQTNLTLEQMDVIELNEAFAAQALGVTRQLGLKDDDARVNPNGGAIAIGHPLGASGARLVTTAINQLEKTSGRYALISMCVGVGQGIALIIERV
ncbi:MAG: 3-oxoadipyl-CoA thiolase [Gammaproteobacteria bacterium]|uniref:3-oxoadipyl-CoA thiolase n=1 Tax=Marinomonas sp. BSi20584 TaxID=1594462 RepID=UPI000C1DEAB2|nr:3-oxoadipyl-CoA thiolase [Marinomonas sp. BSi20584]MBU1293484.1 3-oxoadipyl-CoA thiolase [Gammaproteobacteria bacterium]MBU1466524.1 3-oxoadipyl-CoA thiolase [Gammaproteobacteria bacterium]MBU2021304.1 3-oxoadipyl-CoA thiolase [Gammaproteobacteria bacterium]MBU2239321.1 3-oxoadipyl-CoA thiolase [Gammaproteobacteria bacterium]MBU2317988.1 3-oxoadipyl-CoA thiolase [Gammaproteobacteria bacterium]